MRTSTCLSLASTSMLGPNQVTIGDTCLIDQLLGFCSLYPNGELLFTAPFFDRNLIDRIIENTSREIALSIVVSSVAAARRMSTMVAKRGRRVTIYVSEALHAKVYVFECKRRVMAAMIGSHNPTRAGTKANLEVGVFLSATPGRPEWLSIQQTREFIIASSNFNTELPNTWR
jgi:phosphatidylserine/phosphatidylglycerophosphate/cardiolipin synthase-like enzyme